MMRREIRMLVAGIMIGLAAASAAFLFWNRGPAGSAAEAVAPRPIADEPRQATEVEQAEELAVQLTADEQRQIGLQTAEVRPQRITEQITAAGRVEEPETAIRTISARVGGRIDRLFVNFTGQPVQIGQPVAEIYSPEIFTAAEEYKLALENRQHLAVSQQAAAITQADALVEASRRRLELWGLNPGQIDELVTAPETPIHITIASSATGIIRTRNITEGQYVDAGAALFDVIDLAAVWVEADVFQSDIGRIRPGLRAQVMTDALPGTTLRGIVSFIKPQSNPESRTTPVRIQIDNAAMKLRPGMFVTTVFDIPLGANVLTVPRSAVTDTGTGKIVYLALPDGVFERRSVETGTPGKDYYPVVSGLSEGDRVVTNGAFLIDSQTRLTGGMTGLFGGSTSFDSHRITFRIDPDPPMGARENTVHIGLLDPAGNAVSDAQVRMTVVMPAMPAMGMPEMRGSADLPWSGSEYAGPITIATAGSWNVVVEARRGTQLLATYRTRFDAR